MAESSTINITQYVNNVASGNKASTSKFMDKSNTFANDFADVFDNINKTFTTQEDSSTKFASDTHRKDTENVNPAKTEKKEKTDNHIEDKHKNSESDNKQIKDEDETTKNKVDDTSTKNKQDEKDTKDINQKKETKQETKTEDDKKTVQDSTENTQKTDAEAIAQNTNELNQAVSIENLIEIAAQAIDTKVNENTQPQNNVKSDVKTDVKIDTQITQQENVPQSQIDELTKLVQNLPDTITTQTNNIKVQPQTQQALSNVKIEQQDTTKDTKKEIKEQTNIKDSNVQTPVIKVNTEVIASDVNLNQNSSTTTTNTKQSIKDMLNKTSLTQDILDKTNARIVSVSTTSSSDSGNLLNKQNPEEQAIKMTLQGSNITGTTDNINQANFAQTLDNAQAPKELNKTEILSQIYNKLDNIKEEGTTKINIVLKPENLGKINLELINGKDGLTAKMTTDNAQVKELLDKSLNSLKDTLGSQGINVNTVTVKIEDTQKSSDTSLFEQGYSNQQDNQAFSNNQQNQNQNQKEFSLNQEIENITNTIDKADESEHTGTLNTHAGQVDYKI